MAAKDFTRIPSAQPVPRLHKGDVVISLSEMVEQFMPTARPLMSLADLRAQEGTPLSVDEVLDRICRRDREDGQ